MEIYNASCCQIPFPNITAEACKSFPNASKSEPRMLNSDDSLPDWAKWTLGAFLSLIILTTVVGNILVIITFLRCHNFKTFTKSLVISLALADGTVALLVMPVGLANIINDHEWKLTQTACHVFICIDVTFTTTSIFHLSCLALDRYLAVCYPFFYEERMSKKMIITALAICWTIPLLISFVPILNRWNTAGIEDILTRYPTNSCVFVVNAPYALICSTIAFYIPIFFMLGCNIKIYQVARRHLSEIRRASVATDLSSDHVGSRRYFHGEAKAAKTLGIIMSCFCICWFPFFIMNILDPFINYSIHPIPWGIVTWLGYVNSTLNPFLYYFFNKKFREGFLIILGIKTKREYLRERASFLHQPHNMDSNHLAEYEQNGNLLTTEQIYDRRRSNCTVSKLSVTWSDKGIIS